MATKKAKPKSKKTKTTPVNKKTVTRVVSAKTAKKTVTAKATASGNIFQQFGRFLLEASTLRMAVIELLGVFAIASVFLASQGHPLYMMFAVIGVYLALGTATDGFFNPALTFGAWINRKLDGMKAIVQVVAQVLGGMLSLVTFQAFIKASAATAEEVAGGAAATSAQLVTLQPLEVGKEWYVFAAEIIGVLLISLVLARAIASKRSVLEKAMSVGGAFLIATIIASTAAGYAKSATVINPSLLTTLQAFSGEKIKETWAWIVSVYIVAPLIGGVIGFFLGDTLKEEN